MRKDPYTPENDHGIKKAQRKATLDKIMELCAKEGVDSALPLSEEDVKRFMRLTHAEKHMITLIGSGFPVRNATAILSAIKLKLERSAPVPREGGGGTPITVTVNTLTREAVLAALPPIVAEKYSPKEYDYAKEIGLDLNAEVPDGDE